MNGWEVGLILATVWFVVLSVVLATWFVADALAERRAAHRRRGYLADRWKQP